MITFTVPGAMRAFLRSHQRLGYEALFAASSAALKTLAANPRYGLGDTPGFFGVLHTWGRTLDYHPHIHYVVLGYLSRYVFKVTISNERILSIDSTHVRFAYTDSKHNRRRTMRLTVTECLRRFLQHVLPTGFMKLRYYGFLASNFARPFEQIRARVEIAHGFDIDAPTAPESPPPQPLRCEHCGARMRRVRVISRAPITIMTRTAHAHYGTALAAGP